MDLTLTLGRNQQDQGYFLVNLSPILTCITSLNLHSHPSWQIKKPRSLVPECIHLYYLLIQQMFIKSLLRALHCFRLWSYSQN